MPFQRPTGAAPFLSAVHSGAAPCLYGAAPFLSAVHSGAALFPCKDHGGDVSLIDFLVQDAVHPSSSHSADAARLSSSSQEGRTSASIDLGRSTAPSDDATSANTKDAEADYTPVHVTSSPPLSTPPSLPPTLNPSLTPSDATVSADLTQPALASGSSSSASSSPVATGPAPAPADSAGGISDQAIQVRLVEDISRASSHSPVAPLSRQSSTGSASGPAGSSEDDLADPDQAAVDQNHAEAHDLSAGGVSNAADALSARQSSSSADGGDAADSEEDVLPEVQPAAEQSVAAAGTDPLSPQNAVDLTEVMPGMLGGYQAWQSGRVWPAAPGYSGFGLVVAVPQAVVQYPQPAAVHPEPADVNPQPAATGPQPAAADPQPIFEVEHATAEIKEGPQWNVQAAPWVPGQAKQEVLQQPQQQHAGSLRTDSSLLLGTSMSEAAATKQQLQQQLGGMNGNAVPFFPKLAAAKQLQQEDSGKKEGAGLFGRQGAGLLQQQQANSPKIPAVKVNVLSVLCNIFWLLTVVIHIQFSL